MNRLEQLVKMIQDSQRRRQEALDSGKTLAEIQHMNPPLEWFQEMVTLSIKAKHGGEIPPAVEPS